MSNQKTLSERRTEAELIVEQIRNELSSAKEAIKKSEQELSIAIKHKKEFGKLAPQINLISKNANSSIEIIRNDRDRLKRLLRTVNSFYNNKYTPLVKKINDPNTGLSARWKEGNQFHKDLQKVKVNYEKQIALINQLYSDFRKKLSELKAIENSLRRINVKILDHEKTITQKRARIEEDFLKVELSTKSIASSELKIIKKENEIKILHNDSEKAYKQISSWYSDAYDTLEKIRKIYELAAGTGLGGEFDKRRKVLDADLKKWRKQLLIITSVLFGVIICLFILQLVALEWDFAKLKFDANFYVRFLITSPIIYYLVFVTKQYNRTKALLEKYSFKTTLALSIDAHINLLTGIENFQKVEQQDKILDFILSGFNKIYEAPYQNSKTKKEIGTDELLKKVLKRLPIE